MKTVAEVRVEREDDPHPLAIVAADLEAVGAPAPIAFIDRNATVMAPLDTANMALPPFDRPLRIMPRAALVGIRIQSSVLSRFWSPANLGGYPGE